MTKPLFALLLLILAPLALAGCLDSPDEDSTCIGFPGPGASADRMRWVQNDQSDLEPAGYANISVSGPGTVFGGDGKVHEVVHVNEAGGNVDHVSLQTGDIVKTELLGGQLVQYTTNNVMRLGNLFFGRCLSTGDQWTAPHYTPEGGIEVSVQYAGADRIEARAVRLPFERAIFGNGTVDGRVFEFLWTESRLFPDEVRNFELAGNETGELSSTLRLVRQEVELVDVRPEEVLKPIGRPSPVVRWPDFELPETNLPFSEFVAEAEARPETMEYLSVHPDAYASWIRYEEVQEQESHATVWTAILRDETETAIRVEWVYRCFENLLHRILYGDCHYGHEYFGPGSNDPNGEPATLPVSPMAKPADLSSVPVRDILAIASGIVPGETPVRINWLAHPMNPPEKWQGAAMGSAGWEVEFGEIRGEMILSTQGPMGNSGGYTVDIRDLDLDAVGWATGRWWSQ